MALLQDWRDVAYSQETDKKQLQKFWSDYFLTEKGIYEAARKPGRGSKRYGQRTG